MSKLKIIFLGTSSFVQIIRKELSKHFILVESLSEADPDPDLDRDDLIGADLAVVASYGHILSKEELNKPKYGCINVHPSLLPKYRGPTPIQQAILNGDEVSGISIIKMDEDIDHGPIIYQETLDLSDRDNFHILSKKMFQFAADKLPKIIEDFVSGKLSLTPQDHAKATYCEKLTRNSGYFDITTPPDSEKLDRMIRAYFPWPGVWCKWSPSAKASGDKQAKIVKFLPSASHPELDSGSMKFVVQMEGKKPISFKDFLNGYPDFPLRSP